MAKHEKRRFLLNMKAVFEIGTSKYKIDFSKKYDISIPLIFNGNQPNTYGVEKAASKPYEDNQFIGDTRKGGPCNFETYTLTPHCNGTHTECIGHITQERINIIDSLNEEMIPSTLISITPRSSEEQYIPELHKENLVITKEDLIAELENISNDFLEGLIVRTLPNSENKKNQNYLKEKSSFFTIEAMEYIVNLGIKHLLVDLPSVDRLLDEGILSSHNIFWETKEKKFNPNAKNKTITELIFVPDAVENGCYLLNLQIPSFIADAAPSRPILYTIDEL